jgi:hypothetical protein
MVNLLHEIWETYDDDQGEQPLQACCLAGPDGADFRRMLDPRARLVHTFEAGSYYEAMTVYYRFWGWGEYTTDHAWDMEPYPADWLERQQSKG